MLSGILFLGGGVARADSHSQGAIRAFNEGAKLLQGGKAKDAMFYFDQAISNDDAFPEAYYARAICRHELGQIENALADINDAIRLKSDFVEPRSLRGSIYFEQGQYDAAMEDFNWVLERKPTDGQALLGRAVIALKNERHSAALRDFQAFLRAQPNSSLAPKIRKLVSALRGAAAEAPESAASRPAPPNARTVPSQAAHTSADIQALADSLFQRRSLSEQYGRKVLKGERAEVAGDIHSESSAGGSGNQDTSGNDLQVIEPR